VNVVEDIWNQVDEELSSEDQLGDKVIQGLANRAIKHFKAESSSTPKDTFNRNKLPANWADVSVLMMNR